MAKVKDRLENAAAGINEVFFDEESPELHVTGYHLFLVIEGLLAAAGILCALREEVAVWYSKWRGEDATPPGTPSDGRRRRRTTGATASATSAGRPG